MNHLALITKREYLTKVRNKSFVIMTFLSPLILVGIFALIAYLTDVNKDTVRTIYVLDESGVFQEEFQSSPHMQYKLIFDGDLEATKEKAVEDEAYGLVYIPNETDPDILAKSISFYAQDAASFTVIGVLNNLLESKLNTLKLREAGIDSQTIRDLHVNVSMKQETFGGKQTSEISSGVKLAFGAMAGYLLFMFIIIYGNMIMRSVIEEKTSRVIEVIVSSVKPRSLLLGKIFGTTLAGITQFVIWIVLIAILSSVASAAFGVDTSAMASSPAAVNADMDGMQEIMSELMSEVFSIEFLNLIIMFLLFFIGGYLLYASLYAAIGAAVDSETDTQQFMMPIVMPLVLAVYIGAFTVIENPHGSISQIFSYIPFTSPVVMLMRIPFGVPLWQQLISVALVFLTFLAVVWFAAKIYRVGILMYGKKPSYKEMIKWLKY